MPLGRRLVHSLLSRFFRHAQQASPGRTPLAAFLVAMLGPLLGALVGAIGGALLGLALVVGAGKGVAHSGAAAGVVLGLGALCILVGAALGLELFLALATLARGVRYLLGRRPWPWRGSVHFGALLLGLAVFFALDLLGRHPSAHTDDGAATVLRLAADGIGLMLALPALLVGGLAGSWVHRRVGRASAAAQRE